MSEGTEGGETEDGLEKTFYDRITRFTAAKLCSYARMYAYSAHIHKSLRRPAREHATIHAFTCCI